jgi:hypothetical protein
VVGKGPGRGEDLPKDPTPLQSLEGGDEVLEDLFVGRLALDSSLDVENRPVPAGQDEVPSCPPRG